MYRNIREEHSLQNEDQLLQSTDSVHQDLLLDENHYSPAKVMERQSEWMVGMLTIMSVVGIAAIFYRAYVTGWLPLFYVYSFLCGLSIVMFALRNRLSPSVRNWYIIGFHLLAGFSGISVYGVVAPVLALLPTGVVLTAMFYSIGSALRLSCLVAPVFALLGVLHVKGLLATAEFGVDALDVSFWVAGSVIAVWVAAFLIFPLAAIIRHFNDSYQMLERKSLALLDSEREFRELFESAVDCVYRTDLEGRIINISPSAKDLLGYDAEALIGKKMSDYYVNSEQRAGLLAALKANPDGVSYFEAHMRNVEGTPQLIASNVGFWRNASGEIIGVSGVARNIDAQRKAEEHLRIVQKTESLGSIAGGVAHDINNLLTVIVAKAEGLADPDSPEQLDSLEEIIRTSRQGSDLLKQLLRFSRPDLLNPSEIEVAASIESMRDVLAISAGHDVEVFFDLATGQRQILVDESQFQSVLINLIVNSRQAMVDGGSVYLTATTVVPDEDGLLESGERIEIRVTDTGPGMSETVLSRALEPFFTTKSIGEGYGLGLSVIDRFIRDSGGTFRLESKEGQGTTAIIELPVHISRTEYESSGKVDKATNGDPGNESRSILLIEDTEQLQRLLFGFLSAEGYSVSLASDGEEALGFFNSGERFDLILSDITLPGEHNGFEVCRRFIEKDKSQRVIFMTGYAHEELDPSDPLSDCSILFKPFGFSELQEEIGKVLSR